MATLVDFSVVAVPAAIAVACVWILPAVWKLRLPSFRLTGTTSNAKGIQKATVQAVGEGLEKQLAALLKTIGNHMDTTTAQSAVYLNAQETLAAANTVEKVQAVVEIMIATIAQGNRDTEQLRRNLNDAQAQTSALRQQLSAVEKLASIDPLTSLPNRRFFQDYFQRAIAQSHTDLTPLCLILADIDHFKKVNDHFGHPTGDAVLKQFAEILSKSVGPNDLAARFGGEEFAIVLNKTAMGSAHTLAQKMRLAISEAKWIDAKHGREIGKVSASFGIAEIIDCESPAQLLERADQQLYIAKRNGRNRIEHDRPLH